MRNSYKQLKIKEKTIECNEKQQDRLKIKVISFFSGLSLVTRKLMNETKMKRMILIPKKLFV